MNIFYPSTQTKSELRLEILTFVNELVDTGAGVNVAMMLAARRYGVSRASIYNWRAKVQYLPHEEWLLALTPASTASKQYAACHPAAWDYLISDYLRPQRPSFSSSYQRLVKIAIHHNWTPIPSERSLRRRLHVETSLKQQMTARSEKRAQS